MEEYLSTAFNKFKSNDFTNITIVMGNESCDLDSAISAIVYAVFLNWKNKDNMTELYIPLLDVDREDFPLKTEVAFCLKQNNISDTNLLFRNEINFKELINSKNLKLILVDHHVLSKKFEFLTSFVVEIIDHRPLDRREWHFNNNLIYKIETVGSCCTLICQKIRENDSDSDIDSDSDSSFFKNYSICAKLLYSVIILDTVNFSKQVNKATPLDHEIVIYIENILKLSGNEDERTKILNDLVKARSDVSELTSEQLLRKDLKIIHNILVPSFPILVKDFLQKSEAIESVNKLLEQKQCTTALLLGMDLDGGLKRDGVIISKEESEGERLLQFLQNWSSPVLDLIFESHVNRLYFKQLNLSASRKQYMPCLNEFINK